MKEQKQSSLAVFTDEDPQHPLGEVIKPVGNPSDYVTVQLMFFYIAMR